MLLKSFIREAGEKLEPVYGKREAAAIVRTLWTSVLGVPACISVTEPDFRIPEGETERLEDCLARLCASEPLQYVLGKTEFYGLEYRVSPSVLIPRPETELLCRMILQDVVPSLHRDSPRILDLCTGSGCIAWTLAHYLPDSQVIGADISAEALDVASSQGIPGNAPDFLLLDVLSSQDNAVSVLGDRKFDLIVSNPPYVRDSEKKLMHRNVLDYEPAAALFVPDDDPLLFYRAIAGLAERFLAEDGAGAVEINEAFGGETARLFLECGFSDVRVVRDFSDRERFVIFRKP